MECCLSPKEPDRFPLSLTTEARRACLVRTHSKPWPGIHGARVGVLRTVPTGPRLSASAGPYIGDEIAAAEKKGGTTAGAAALVRLLETDHLQDQLAAVAWLRTQRFVRSDRIAVAGNSFGGIETVLGAERGTYCAAIDSAGGAQSWAQAPELQSLMTRAVRNSTVPIFFFQAANDYDLSPSKTLSEAMKEAGKTFEMKIYSAYGKSVQEGHTFGYFGSSIWATDVFRFLDQHCTK